jgi:hypothetical protein
MHAPASHRRSPLQVSRISTGVPPTSSQRTATLPSQRPGTLGSHDVLEHVPLAVHVPLAQLPHDPPQPSEPHSRPLQLGVHMPVRGPQSPQSVPSAQTENRLPGPPSSHSPSFADGQVSLQSMAGAPASSPGNTPPPSPTGPLSDPGAGSRLESHAVSSESETKTANAFLEVMGLRSCCGHAFELPRARDDMAAQPMRRTLSPPYLCSSERLRVHAARRYEPSAAR